MLSIFQDLRFAARGLAKDKGFAAVALLTLALCIGANTAIFSIVHAVLLRPLPFPEAERLVTIYNSYPNAGIEKASNSVPDYFDRRALTEVFEEVAVLDMRSATIGEAGSPERVERLWTSPSLFGTLRVRPALGRFFTEQEAEPGNEKVAILSHELWQTRHGGQASALGQSLRIDGEPHEIVGVLPAGFELLDERPQLVTPASFTDEQKSDDARHSNFLTMLARLKPGVTQAQARERIEALNAGVLERFPRFTEILASAGFHTRVLDLHEEMVAEVRPTLYLLQWGVAFVLIIGCVNIANLLLIRSAGRRQELAVRFALGAGRLRVARQLLTESVLLGVLGGALGLLLGVLGIRLLPLFGTEQLPMGGQVRLDAAVAAFALLLSVGTALLFGLIPVLHALQGSLAGLLRQAGRGNTGGAHGTRWRSAFVLAQVALAFLLLIGAGLLVLSFSRVLRVDPGFDARGVLSAQVGLPRARYADDAARLAFARQALEAIRSLPGVQHAGVTLLLPFGGDYSASVVSVEGYTLAPGETPPVPSNSAVDAAYFRTMGIPLLQGRLFDGTETPDGEKVALVDQAFARRYWPGADPIGKRILRGTPESEREPTWIRVVGVVGSVRVRSLADKDEAGAVYYPFEQRPGARFSFVVKTPLEGSTLLQSVRAEILRLDPELPLYDARSMEERLAGSLVSRRAPMLLLLVFASVALVLSAVGIYGVLAYAVTQQRKEIGVRMALGAPPQQILRQVLWRGGRLVLLGLALGLGGALVMTRYLGSLLFDVQPLEPSALGAAALLLGLVGLAACLLPSVQATRVDPMIALRFD
jgi:predicted permease